MSSRTVPAFLVEFMCLFPCPMPLDAASNPSYGSLRPLAAVWCNAMLDRASLFQGRYCDLVLFLLVKIICAGPAAKSLRWRLPTGQAPAQDLVSHQEAFMRALSKLIACLVLTTPAWAQTRGGKTLDIYVIDVDGGESTLFVSPTGESLLVDAGWPGFEGRDADRIAAVAKLAGLN